MRLPIGLALKAISPLNRFSQRYYMRALVRILTLSGVSFKGNPCWIAPSVLFDLSYPGAIEIGTEVVISQRVNLLTHDFSLDRYFVANGLQPDHLERVRHGSIIIGDYAFIGLGVTVLPGLTIGAGSVVAAGSVVTKHVPPGVVVGGNPARTISTVEDWVPRAEQSFKIQARRK